MKDADFEDVISRVERNKSEATASQYVPKIRDFREWLGKPLEEADAIDVEDWLAELDEYYSNSSSVGKASAALVAAYEELNKLIEAGRIDGNGWVRETPPEQASYTPKDSDTAKSRETKQNMHYLKPEQVDAMARTREKTRDELIIRLLFHTGIRVSELCETRLKDVDRKTRTIRVRGKGRKNRPVGWQPSIDILMDLWIDEHRPAVYYAEESDYLFPTSHSEQITTYTISEIVSEAAEEAGLQKVYGENTEGQELRSITPHVLRHSFAMAALQEHDWNVYTLSQALGHASTEITTGTYLHDDEEDVLNAFESRGPGGSD